MSGGFLPFLADPIPQEIAAPRRTSVRRRITPDAGRGLEKLGHALEYLADEFVHNGCDFAADWGRLQAIDLMARLNREIYFACGVEPTFREKLQSLLRRFLNRVPARRRTT